MATVPVARVRHRAYMPKSKTGCKTCKIRKVKCDEGKPHCRRCTTTGRTCDGYNLDLTSIRASQPTRTSTTSPPLVNQGQDVVDFVSETRSFNVPSFLLPSLRLETVDERISFQFFVTHAGPALARSSNSIFWQRQVLQAAHQHVSVQHCLMALGAMYRRFFECTSAHVDSDVANQHFQFALRQSNKAIQQLVKQQTRSSSIDAADKLTVMTCCILFGSLANLQGQQQAALDHLRSGIRMLRETTSQSHNSNAHPVSLGSLRSILTGLDIQARSSINWSDIQSWEPFFPTPQPSDAADIDISHPRALSELHCHIETLLNDTLAFNRGCVARPFSDRESVQHEHNALIWRYDRISQTLSSIHSLPLPSSHSPSQDLSRVLLLHAQTQHYLRSSIPPLKHHFNIHSPLSHTPYDATTLFSDMMSNAVHLLSATSPSGPIYTVAPGPLAALWLIATSAPSSCVALRKRAIELMLSHPRREGLFDGMLAGRIGRVAWGLEQAGARRELSVDGGRGERGIWWSLRWRGWCRWMFIMRGRGGLGLSLLMRGRCGGEGGQWCGLSGRGDCVWVFGGSGFYIGSET